MRRLTALILLILALVFYTTLGWSIPVASQWTATLRVGSGQVLGVEEGGTIIVPITAQLGPQKLGAFTLSIIYDPAVLTAVSCQAATSLWTSEVCNASADVNKVKFSGAHVTGVSYDAYFGTIQFAPVSGVTGGSSPIQIVAETWADPRGIPMYVQEWPTIITVYATAPTPTTIPPTATSLPPTPVPTWTPIPSATPTPLPSIQFAVQADQAIGPGEWVTFTIITGPEWGAVR